MQMAIGQFLYAMTMWPLPLSASALMLHKSAKPPAVFRTVPYRLVVRREPSFLTKHLYFRKTLLGAVRIVCLSKSLPWLGT